jgi:hypothetical protein
MRISALLALIALIASACKADDFLPYGDGSIDIAGRIDVASAPPIESTITNSFGVIEGETAGGTFLAGGSTLQSFVLYMSQNGPTLDEFRAVVLGTDNSGRPILPALWQSGDQAEPSGSNFTPFTFSPNLSIDSGRKYFVGVDTGFSTGVAPGTVMFAVNEANSIPDGQIWLARIPEPTTALMFTIGSLSAALGWPRGRALRLTSAAARVDS